MLESEFYLDEAVQSDMRYISDRMREARESYGESQLDFSETLQVSRNTVYRQENTLSNLSVDYLIRLVRTTKISVERLFPPELLGGLSETGQMYAHLNEANKEIVQNTVNALVSSLLSLQSNATNTALQ